MSQLAQKTALWGAQNRLRMVRDRVAPLSPFTLIQAGANDDELADQLTVLGGNPIEEGAVTSDGNLSSIRKDATGRWFFVLRPFVIPPLILPRRPYGWNGTFAQGREQELPIERETGKGMTLWLHVVGSIQRVQVSLGVFTGRSGEYQIVLAELLWAIQSFTPPAAPAIPGSSVQTVSFDWWAEIMIPDTLVPVDHQDYNKPAGGTDYSVSNSTREFYPPYLYI